MKMADKEAMTVLILMTSDVHGFVLPRDYGTGEPAAKGLAKAGTLIRRLRRDYPRHLTVDNGDLIQGSPLTFYQARCGGDTLHPMVACLESLVYDAAVVGNHEFNYGPGVLTKVMEESQFPWLAANICRKGTKEPAFGEPYLLRTFPGDCRVAVLGLTTKYIPFWEHPTNIAAWDFIDPVETARVWVPFLRREKGADAVIVAYHGGLERDPKSGEPLERLTGENQAYQICTEVEGIDVLLGGHQHRGVVAEVAGVQVIQPENDARQLAKVVLTLEQDRGHWRVSGKKADLLEVGDVPADAEIERIVRPYEEKTQAWLEQPLGRVRGNMRIEDPMAARLADNPYIEFVNRVQMHYSEAPISCASIFADTCPGFSAQVTMRQILANYMYPNTLRVLRVRGETIRQALEVTATFFERGPDGAPGVNPAFCRPKVQHYNYDMWEGIEYTLDISRPAGSRVVLLNQGGEPLDPCGFYDVVMNNYRAAGGSLYGMFSGAEVVRDIQTEVSELLTNYFLEHEWVEATCDHNWRVTGCRARFAPA